MAHDSHCPRKERERWTVSSDEQSMQALVGQALCLRFQHLFVRFVLYVFSAAFDIDYERCCLCLLVVSASENSFILSYNVVESACTKLSKCGFLIK